MKSLISILLAVMLAAALCTGCQPKNPPQSPSSGSGESTWDSSSGEEAPTGQLPRELTEEGALQVLEAVCAALEAADPDAFYALAEDYLLDGMQMAPFDRALYDFIGGLDVTAAVKPGSVTMPTNYYAQGTILLTVRDGAGVLPKGQLELEAQVVEVWEAPLGVSALRVLLPDTTFGYDFYAVAADPAYTPAQRQMLSLISAFLAGFAPAPITLQLEDLSQEQQLQLLYVTLILAGGAGEESFTREQIMETAQAAFGITGFDVDAMDLPETLFGLIGYQDYEGTGEFWLPPSEPLYTATIAYRLLPADGDGAQVVRVWPYKDALCFIPEAPLDFHFAVTGEGEGAEVSLREITRPEE